MGLMNVLLLALVALSIIGWVLQFWLIISVLYQRLKCWFKTLSLVPKGL